MSPESESTLSTPLPEQTRSSPPSPSSSCRKRRRPFSAPTSVLTRRSTIEGTSCGSPRAPRSRERRMTSLCSSLCQFLSAWCARSERIRRYRSRPSSLSDSPRRDSRRSLSCRRASSFSLAEPSSSRVSRSSFSRRSRSCCSASSAAERLARSRHQPNSRLRPAAPRIRSGASSLTSMEAGLAIAATIAYTTAAAKTTAAATNHASRVGPRSFESIDIIHHTASDNLRLADPRRKSGVSMAHL